MSRAGFDLDGQALFRRLAIVVDKADRPGRLRLSPEEVAELSTLLRGASYDLAAARSGRYGSTTERRLNELVARAHHAFYRNPPAARGVVAQFFTMTFPRRVRENRAFVFAAALAFALPFVVSWGVVDSDPSLAHRILPGAVLYSVEEMYDSTRSELDGSSRDDAAMAGFYVRNNVSIAFQCVALGAFIGLGTLYVLFSNGVELGTMAGFVTGGGHGGPFLDFVISHSALELSAIVIAGAAGLILGHAILASGRASKLEPLTARARVAAELSGGAGALLLAAAVIEGFWSAGPFPFAVKCAVGASLWVAVATYLAFGGRQSRA